MGATTLCLHMCVMTETRWHCDVSCTDEKVSGPRAAHHHSAMLQPLQEQVQCAPSPPQALEAAGAGAMYSTTGAGLRPPRDNSATGAGEA